MGKLMMKAGQGRGGQVEDQLLVITHPRVIEDMIGGNDAPREPRDFAFQPFDL